MRLGTWWRNKIGTIHMIYSTSGDIDQPPTTIHTYCMKRNGVPADKFPEEPEDICPVSIIVEHKTDNVCKTCLRLN